MEIVSIIVPIYKVEPYIRQCINSILNQTYKNLEIILVDDGSPDDCGMICDEYAQKDTRIKVIHKENGGLSSARNAGLEVAKGDFIAFIDSDDYVSENFIKILYDLCIKNNADIAECDFIKFEIEPEELLKKEKIEKFTALEMQERIYSNDYVRTIVVWNKLYRREVYKDLRFPDGKINEDEFTTYKAFDKCNKGIVTTNQELYYYRYNENSIMGRKFNAKRLDALDAFEERKEYYREKAYTELYEKTVEKYQNILKTYYLLTKKYIKSSNKYLNLIKKRAKENNIHYKKLTNISKREKIMMTFFVIFPNSYYRLKYLKETIGNIRRENDKK